MRARYLIVVVGNVPYDASEQELLDLFSTAGSVSALRMVTDKDTGKPKGYGFCEYNDPEAAKSALRNLNNAEFHGRSLRIDFASNDTVAGGDRDVRMEEPAKPADPISKLQVSGEAMRQTILGIKDEERLEVISQMKILMQQNPAGARELLQQNPQLAQAILHIMMSFRMLTLEDLANFTLKKPAAPSARPDARAPPARGAPSMDQQQMLERVMHMTEQQIRELPPHIQQQVHALRSSRMNR